MKILCVKDLEANRHLLQRLFKGKGHEIAFAEDPFDALEKIDQPTTASTPGRATSETEFPHDRNWKSFFNSATAGLAIIDAEQRFLHLNEMLARMNGFSIQAHIGKTMREVIPGLADTLEGFHQKAMAGETILNVEFPREPGAIRHWSASHFPIYGNCEKPTGMGAIVVEITEQHRTGRLARKGKTIPPTG